MNGTCARGQQPDKEIDRLAKAYHAARTEFERRAVCLEAIDTGVIAVGRPLAVSMQSSARATSRSGGLRSTNWKRALWSSILCRRRPAMTFKLPTSAGILASVSIPLANWRITP